MLLSYALLSQGLVFAVSDSRQYGPVTQHFVKLYDAREYEHVRKCVAARIYCMHFDLIVCVPTLGG